MRDAILHRVDVLIVLGAALTRDGAPTQSLERRVKHAVGLYRAGVAQTVLLTGGAKRGHQSEARAMANLMRQAGVPEGAVVLEDMAKTTFGNATRCEHIMRAKGWTSALIVTDDFHLPRALLAFRSAGVNASGSPVQARLDIGAVRWMLHAAWECAGLIWYSAKIAGTRLHPR